MFILILPYFIIIHIYLHPLSLPLYFYFIPIFIDPIFIL